MPCGCSDNGLNNSISDNDKLINSKSKKLHLEDMKNMSIDEIVKLYKDGYILEGLENSIDTMSNMPHSKIYNTNIVPDANIVSLGCVGNPSLEINRPVQQQGGYTIFKGTVGACKFYPTSRCLDTVAFPGARCYSPAHTLYFEIREDDSATNLPKGVPGGSLGLIKQVTDSFPTSFPGYSYPVTFQAELPYIGAPYWITIRSSDYICGGGTTGQERVELSYSWLSGDKIIANYGPVVPCGWTSPGDNISWAIETYSTTYFISSDARVSNICWGNSLGASCSIPPEMPAITTGTQFTIKADLANAGGTGKIRAVFKANGIQISDQNTPSLATFPGGGLWSPTVSYTMPSTDVTLVIDGYGWNGTGWVLTNTNSALISSTPSCTSVSLDPYSASVDLGQSVTFTATVTPLNQVFTVNFKLVEIDTSLGTQPTSGGSCQFVWNTSNPPGLVAGNTYHVLAEVVGQLCHSTSPGSGITLSAPIQQWTLGITVEDVGTLVHLQGVSVTVNASGPPVGTQTLTTDLNGYAQFIATQGAIDITMSKTGYNTRTTSDGIYNNKQLLYDLTPTTPNPGSLRFLTVPSGAEVFFGTVSKGTTDNTTGILQIDNLPAGQLVSYTVKKTGYNDSTGSVTVQSDTVLNVPVTLTLVTPTTGDACIKSNPSGASIKIDDTPQSGKVTASSGGGCVSSNIIYNLSPTSHSYELSLAGFQNKTGTFTPSVGTTIQVDAGTLVPLSTVGNVTITSTPSGARIYIDNVDTQYATPATIQSISQGSHTYKLVLAGYIDGTGNFTIVSGQTTTVPNVVLVQRLGGLKFLSTPVGAEILIGGISKGITTVPGLTVSNLPIGLTDYVAMLASYDDYNGSILVEENITKDITIVLIPSVTEKGSLHIESAPPGAEIFIDGVDKQLVTPQTISELDTGGHVYRLTKSGYNNYTDNFTISDGQTTSVSISLIPTGTLVLTSISPANPTIKIDSTQQFLAKDQNNDTISSGVTWGRVGTGDISTTGLYYSGSIVGNATISATYSAITITTLITVVETLPQEGGAGMLLGLLGVTALGMMMTAKKPQQKEM